MACVRRHDVSTLGWLWQGLVVEEHFLLMPGSGLCEVAHLVAEKTASVRWWPHTLALGAKRWCSTCRLRWRSRQRTAGVCWPWSEV